MPPGSLARLVDLLFDVLDGGQFGDTRLGLLVGHLGGRRGEVLVALDTTQHNQPRVMKRKKDWTVLNC